MFKKSHKCYVKMLNLNDQLQVLVDVPTELTTLRYVPQNWAWRLGTPDLKVINQTGLLYKVI